MPMDYMKVFCGVERWEIYGKKEVDAV